MVQFMTITSFPGHRAKEIGKLFPKLPKLPDFVKAPTYHVTVSNDCGEIVTYGVYEVDDDKAHEGYVAIAKRLTGYFDVEEVKYKVVPCLTIRESLSLLGL